MKKPPLVSVHEFLALAFSYRLLLKKGMRFDFYLRVHIGCRYCSRFAHIFWHLNRPIRHRTETLTATSAYTHSHIHTATKLFHMYSTIKIYDYILPFLSMYRIFFLVTLTSSPSPYTKHTIHIDIISILVHFFVYVCVCARAWANEIVSPAKCMWMANVLSTCNILG